VERLLTIGEFAQRCGLSRSALRFYDQNELLRPRLVDEETGYRYYAVGQLDRALLVRRLRCAEMPVGVLREYLEAPVARRAAMLEGHLAAFRERAAAVEAAVGRLRGDLGAGGDEEEANRRCVLAPAELASGLGQVSFAVADADARAELSGVWIETKEDSLRLVATDSYRLAVRDLLPEQIGSTGIRGLIGSMQARDLAAELPGASSLVLSQSADGGLVAAVDGRVHALGGPGGGFPDYERILLGQPAGDRIALPRDGVERALAELAPEAPHVRLGLEPERLVLEAAGRRRSVPGIWPGPPLQILVDRRFLYEAVSATVGPDLVIEASDPLQPVLLRSADTGTFTVLTMPIRPPDRVTPETA